MKNYYNHWLRSFQHFLSHSLFVTSKAKANVSHLLTVSFLSLILILLGTFQANAAARSERGGKVVFKALTLGDDFTQLTEQEFFSVELGTTMADCDECLLQISLSLDPNCERLITADMVLKDPTQALAHPDYYELRLTIGNGLLIGDNILRAQHLGKEINAMVTYRGPGPCPQGTACMTTITLHNEFEVTITPNQARTVYCSDTFLDLDPSASDYLYRPTAVQTCGVPVEGPFFGGDWVTIHDCVLGEQDTAKTILRQWWAISKDGRRTLALDTIYVLRLPPISALNFFCPEKDTLFCGMSDQPIGPYMLVPNLGSMTDCDTIFFMDPDLATNPLDPHCGISVKIDSLEYGNTGCVGLKRFKVQVHQNCYGMTPNTICQLPTESAVQLEGGNGLPIYATCEFWLTDLDTLAPYISCNLDNIVELDEDCADGFTLSHGYWKTHSIFGPAPYDDTWALLPLAENTPFFLSGQTHFEVINAVPQGNAYYILGFQYVATKLNFLNGTDPSSVQTQYDQATALFMQYTPAEIAALPGNSPIRSQFIMLAMVLDDYNTGNIGPGMCQEGLTLPATTVEAGPDCIARFKLQKVMSMDACHEVKLVKAMVESFGFVTYEYDSASGYWISNQMINLPLRDEPYLVVLEAVDECYNVGRDSCAVVVVDATNPVAVAHSGLLAQLSQKVGWLEADQIDNNSTDNCGINLVLARRSDWVDHWLDFCDTAAFTTQLTPDMDTVWCRIPQAVNGEVEAIYEAALTTFAAEARPCDLLLYQSWYYDLCKYASIECQNAMDETTFKERYAALFPDTDIDAVSQIGGGWAEVVPFTCSDVCDSITVELLVMDFWCNWNTTWTKVYVEDKTPAMVVSELTSSLSLSCTAYNQPAYNLSGSADVISLADIFTAVDTGNVEAQLLLDSLLGGYEKAWMGPMSQYLDINGNPIDVDHSIIDSGICECSEVEMPVRYYDLATNMFVVKPDSIVQVCGTTEMEIPITKGVVLVNCNDNTHCIQDIDFDLDECGLGTVTRNFKIWKSCGNEIPDTLERSQVITLMNHCELNKFMFDLPADTLVDGCAPIFDPSGNGNVIGFADPAVTGEPVFNFINDCRMVAIAHEDLVKTDANPAPPCFMYTILRTWYLADWCEIGDQNGAWWENQSYVADSFLQVIIIQDNSAPVCEIAIEGLVNDTVSVGTCPNGDLYANFYTFDTCGSQSYSFTLDTLSDPPRSVSSGNNNLPGNVRDTMLFHRPNVIPGNYRLVFTIEDACGNVGMCIDSFVVVCDVNQQAGFAGNALITPETAIEVDKNNIDHDVLFQNRPNPFYSTTIIGFDLTKPQSARLTIMDIQGRVIKVIDGKYPSGYSEVEISAAELGTKGVIYYQLETSTSISTRRMIIAP